MCLIAGLLLAAMGMFAAAPSVNADFEPLWAYQGTWHVVRKDAKDGKADIMINRCAALGQFFSCAQNVNGQPGDLIVFLRRGEPGHYVTQTLMPDGRATGLSDLEIKEGKWVYSIRRNENGGTTYYKTVNTFAGKNNIHFETSHSTNGKDFAVDASGEETRVSK
jgi:hypothetical protein